MFRKSLAVGRFLRWIPRALQQNHLGGSQGQGRANEHSASEPSTAGQSRMRTKEPHMSKPERRIETAFRRDEGCGQHLTDHACCHDMVLHVVVQRPSCSHSSSTTSVFPEERVEICTKELVMVDVAMVPTDFAQVTTQWPASHRSKRHCSTNHRCSCQKTRGEFRTQSSKTRSVDDDRCSVWIDDKTRDLREHDSRTRLAETCGARDESPSSNLGRVKQGEAIRADPKLTGKWPDVHDAERMRTCFAQVFGKAATDPLERRNRRRTEADDVERFLTPCRDLECQGSTGSVRQSAPVYTTITREAG